MKSISNQQPGAPGKRRRAGCLHGAEEDLGWRRGCVKQAFAQVCLRWVVVEEAQCLLSAAATLAGHTEFVPQQLQGGGAIRDGVSNLLVSNAVADAYVHAVPAPEVT